MKKNVPYFVFLSVCILLGIGVMMICVLQIRDQNRQALNSALNEIRVTKRFLLTLEEEKRIPITIVAVGDIMLSRGVASRIVRNSDDFLFPFRLVENDLSRADIRIGNLEGPISSKGENQGSMYSFRADPRTIEGLSFAGFNVLTLANNHMLDWGKSALSDTTELLHAHSIQTVGAGKNEEEANMPVRVNKNGFSISFFGYTNLYPSSVFAHGDVPGISTFNLDRIATDIKLEKEKSDIVIVLIHWGDEYATQANEEQKKIGHMLIDMGADIVIGSHPHVAEEIEQYKNGWIAYSLGNFIFDQNFSKDTMQGVAAFISCEKPHVCSVTSRKIFINKDFQPAFEAL